jgi:hypothetical protein
MARQIWAHEWAVHEVLRDVQPCRDSGESHDRDRYVHSSKHMIHEWGRESNRERRGGIERQGVEMRFYVLFLPKISPFFWFSHSYRVLATAVLYRCKREENRGQSHHGPEAPDPVSSNQVNFVGWHVETWPMVVRCSLWIGNPMSVFWKKIPQSQKIPCENTFRHASHPYANIHNRGQRKYHMILISIL